MSKSKKHSKDKGKSEKLTSVKVKSKGKSKDDAQGKTRGKTHEKATGKTHDKATGKAQSMDKSHGKSAGKAQWGSKSKNEALDPSQSKAEHEALSDEFYYARKNDLTQRVSAKRFRHIEGVSQTALALARIYGVNPAKARLAGLLHDWDKGLNDEEIRQRVKELGLENEIDPWVVEYMPNVVHGTTAARALKNSYPAIPDDVIQAIDRHTTAALDMTPLDMVIYVADALEPSRQFGTIDDLRALVGKVSLEELFRRTYEYWTLLLFERRKPLHPDTVTLWNHYMMQASEKGTKK